jgi:hypothetical protein
MVPDAFAANSFSLARLIGAVTIFQVFILFTFHYLSPFYFLYSSDGFVINYKKRCPTCQTINSVQYAVVGGATQGKGRSSTGKILVVGAVEVIPRRESANWGGRDPNHMGEPMPKHRGG